MVRHDCKDARIRELEEACFEAYRQLTNLQPHIPQSCYPKHEIFIDSHVQQAMEALRKVVPNAPFVERVRESLSDPTRAKKLAELSR